jgi:predicted HicB family RNase H-like nuclease
MKSATTKQLLIRIPPATKRTLVRNAKAHKKTLSAYIIGLIEIDDSFRKDGYGVQP